MVRVNHPPGGHTKLHSETLREPQTVRILQPPGGSSSISFSDDIPDKPSSKSSSEKASSSNGQELKPEEGSTSTAPISAEDSTNKNGVKGKISDEKINNLSNVSENDTPTVSEQPEENLKPDNDSKEFPLPRDFEDASSDSVDRSVSESVKEVEVSESSSEKQSEVVSEVSVTETSSVSISTESSESSKVEVSSVSENQTEEVISDSVSVNKESSSTTRESENEVIAQKKESNGVAKNHDLPPLHIQSNDASSSTATTPSPSVQSPPIKSNEDTRNRVMGQPAEAPVPQQAPPRKIKDHMRSNIFMSDEDYMPVRSSRMNATVQDTTKQEMPAAGQRQRIPPGGFSTKLW